MTGSPEQVTTAAGATPPLGPAWRREAERSQESVLPAGKVAVSCSAPMGVGGLGRHLKEVVDALERTGRPAVCLCDSSRLGAAGERASRKALLDPCVLLGRLPVPMPPGVRARAFSVKFDAYAAEHLPAAEHLIAFNGQAQSQFSAARKARYKSLSLISANSHLRRVARQHARAHSQYPLEGSWASRLLRRNLREYAHADRIYVASEYTRESFLEEGFPDAQLSLFQFTPDPRYAPAATPQHPDTFNIAYVGSLTVAKGVPLLVDAVRRLPYTDLRLELIGGWATRGMRRFVQAACAEDPRISSGPGDPLPHLRAASLYVHPSYEDGFAYAPVEALACGVPTIVSSDTGMKDLIDPTRTGAIVPTGDVDALAEAIAAAYRGELLG